MDDIAEKVLVSIHDFLERLSQSEGLHPDQLTEAHMATTALGYQIARLRYPADTLDKMRIKEAAIVGALVESPGAPPLPRQWQAQWSGGVGAALSRALTHDGALGEPAAVIEQVRAFLVDYHSPMDPVVSAGTKATYQGGRGDGRKDEAQANAIEVTAPLFEAYLANRYPDDQPPRVRAVKRLMGGYSKQTYIVSLEELDGSERTLVVRKDGFGLPTGSSVASEFPVLREVHALGVPVPEPLWLEAAGTSPFTTAFMAVGFAAGTPAHQVLPSEPSKQRQWAQDIAGHLARLHTGTVLDGEDARTPLLAEIDDLQRRIEERERMPHPGLVLGMQWLRDNIDELAGRPCCRIHGDVGFHNFLMQDDRLQALLDWEFSRIGDPAEDLIPIKSFMEQIDAWDDFREAYARDCSFTVDAKAARYFNVWREVRNMVACLGSLNSLLLPGVKDVALSVAGTIYIPKYEVAILDAITEAQEVHV